MCIFTPGIYDSGIFGVCGARSPYPIGSTQQHRDEWPYHSAWELRDLQVKLARQRADERAEAERIAKENDDELQAMLDERAEAAERGRVAKAEAAFHAKLQWFAASETNGVLNGKVLASMSEQDFATYQAWKKGLH
jgi:hypothetical protein